MDLLNEDILRCEEFCFLCSFFNNPNKKASYQSFKINLIELTKKIMKNYLKDTQYSNDSCHCFVYSNMEDYGTYNPRFNIIFIKEAIVKKMYEKKDFTILTVVFHELNHFKLKYDIELGYFDENIVRVLKEELISTSSLYPSFIKVNIDEAKSTYYKDNYEFYSEEKLADTYAIENLLLFIKKANIPLTENQKREIDNLIHKIARQYKNYFRDVHNNMNFNSYVIDFEEAFDILIKDNPSWLEYSQLQIEYYLDENKKVVKRTNEELEELLKKETNQNKIEYIKKLLSKDKKRNNYINSNNLTFNKKIKFSDLKKSNKL